MELMYTLSCCLWRLLHALLTVSILDIPPVTYSCVGLLLLTVPNAQLCFSIMQMRDKIARQQNWLASSLAQSSECAW